MSTKFYDRSIFRTFFEVNDPEVVAWSRNVLEKLLGSNIVPKFIKRSLEFSLIMGTTTHIFALIVEYAKKFRKIENNQTLFKAFIEERGLITSQIKTTNQTSHIFNNYIEEYRKRGTIQIIQQQLIDGYPLKVTPTTIRFTSSAETKVVKIDTRLDWQISIGNKVAEKIPGELLRLIEYKDLSEFIFAPLYPENTGWCLGHSSPCWWQTEFISPLVKGYELGEVVENLSLYPLKGSYRKTEEGALKFTTQGSGVTIDNPSLDQIKKYGFKISNRYDYELSCLVKTDVNISSIGKFGILLYDELGNKQSVYHGKDVWTEATFPRGMELKSWWQLQKAYVKAFEQEKKQITRFQDTVTMPQTENLYLLLTYTTTESVFYIKDLKIRLAELPFKRGYTGKRDLLTIITPNNSERTDEEVRQFSKRYLFPYQITSKWKF